MIEENKQLEKRKRDVEELPPLEGEYLPPEDEERIRKEQVAEEILRIKRIDEIATNVALAHQLMKIAQVSPPPFYEPPEHPPEPEQPKLEAKPESPKHRFYRWVLRKLK